ncbi:MAG TPA: hypothetical protein VK675_02955 [Candidatus Paceibacterota bacterium]|nr:hypothetical protein [Candidatus Paceibacterota bacterium]
MSKFLTAVYKIIAEGVFFIFSYLIGILLVLSFGFLESIGLCIELISGFLITLLFREYIWRRKIRKKQNSTRKRLMWEFIIFFILLQSFLIFTFPLSSVIPQKILENVGLIYPIENTNCAIREELQRRTLWDDRIDYKKVRIVAGGLMRILWTLEQKGFIGRGYARVAETFGSTIYLYDLKECPSSNVYFHEMTHIWQIQHARSRIFGVTTIPSWIRYYYLQITNSNVLYDYGGEAGLYRAKEEGRRFIDFGLEQQAMIVEDWYWKSVDSMSDQGEIFTEEYKELLDYYVDDMRS